MDSWWPKEALAVAETQNASLENKDHDGRQTRSRLSGDVKPSPEISGVVKARPAARNALCIEAITLGQCGAYINKFRASLSPQLRTVLPLKRSK